MQEKIQTSFLCKKEDCGEALEDYAEGQYKEGLLCGEFEKDYYYKCKGCSLIYKWTDYGGWWPFSFEESQVAVHAVGNIPENAKLYNRP
jgi:hypothetical protein